VTIQVQVGSPAAQTLAHLGRCDVPACLVEIDQLGPDGQVQVSHSFSAGSTSFEHDSYEVDEVHLTFQKITVENLIDSTASASDDWSTP
jgi:hypothetical protein